MHCFGAYRYKPGECSLLMLRQLNFRWVSRMLSFGNAYCTSEDALCGALSGPDCRQTPHVPPCKAARHGIHHMYKVKVMVLPCSRSRQPGLNNRQSSSRERPPTSPVSRETYLQGMMLYLIYHHFARLPWRSSAARITISASKPPL